MKILVLANGPSAYRTIHQAARLKPDRIFGVNKSLRIWSECTDYVVTDPNNCRMFMGEAIAAQQRGCRLWLTPRVQEVYGVKASESFEYDEANKDRYSRQTIAHGRSVGIVALQLALRLNPSELFMLGFDGYPPQWMTKHELATNGHHPEIEQYGRANWWADHNETAQHVINQVLGDRVDVQFKWFSPQLLQPPTSASVSVV